MTPALAPAPAAPAAVRRARRDLDAAVLGGVAGGLARHLGLPVLGVRLFFFASTLLGGLGAVLYAAYWLMLPAGIDAMRDEAPGLAGARRDGRRPAARRRVDVGAAAVLAVLGVGVVLAAEAVVGQGALAWVVVLAAVGVALLWRQADEVQRTRWADRTARLDPVRMVLGDGGWAAWTRVLLGFGLLVLALVLLVVREGAGAQLGQALLAVLIGVAGVAVVVGPWVARLVSDLGAERAERVRSQERADVAAHLHDSVLQTLALIQRSAGDAARVAGLARSQERELRAWLFEDDAPAASTLTAALRRVAAEVEDHYGVAIEVVTVGDAAIDHRAAPLVDAAREALVNAAKHAGRAHVDLYAECAGGAAEVFVRDRGPGFDPAAVPADRHGVRHSIVGRLERHGGEAVIRAAAGGGTEVRLRLGLPADPADPAVPGAPADPAVPPSQEAL